MRSRIGTLLIATAASAAAMAEPQSTAPGSWQPHELEFQFVGFTTTYSCDGLEAKLRLLLGQLGARPGFSVQTYGCARGPGMPDKFARARLQFSTLQPAAGAEAGTSTAAAAQTPVTGAWKNVTLAPQRPYALASGDCELIEQFRDRVLPLFATRAVQNQISCVPHEVPAGYSLGMEVFALPGKP